VAARYQGGHSNGNVPYSTREVSIAVAVSKSTAGRLFDELVEKGFLKVARESAFNFKTKTARRWELTQWPLRAGLDRPMIGAFGSLKI
jgi:DNA-binding transcriptional regulator YhcF (GntR family)